MKSTKEKHKNKLRSLLARANIYEISSRTICVSFECRQRIAPRICDCSCIFQQAFVAHLHTIDHYEQINRYFFVVVCFFLCVCLLLLVISSLILACPVVGVVFCLLSLYNIEREQRQKGAIIIICIHSLWIYTEMCESKCTQKSQRCYYTFHMLWERWLHGTTQNGETWDIYSD